MITYCTNIHPGETWDETFSNLRTYLPSIKMAVSPSKPFPIGLRLSHRAAAEIDEHTSYRFKDWCQKHDCYVPTINGFSYGDFHSFPVKEKVYLPDWRQSERVEYTIRLADLLDSWLPENVTGSISTVPVGFKTHMKGDGFSLVKENLRTVLEHLDRLTQRSKKKIILSLEPEPGCVVETIEDVIRFFAGLEFPAALMDHLGICLDCSHQAVEFEKPPEILAHLSGEGIKIGKVQIASALRVDTMNRDVLERFCEPCYLHQVVIRQPDGKLVRYHDLPEALGLHRSEAGEEWRVHFHLPVFMDKGEGHGTTRSFVEEILPLLDRTTLLEVETYTWDVLPPELRKTPVAQSIIRELQWVRSQIDETDRRS